MRTLLGIALASIMAAPLRDAVAPVATHRAPRTIVVSGVIKDLSTGGPVVDATVSAKLEPATATLASTKSDRAGAYRLEIVLDSTVRIITVQVARLGYSPVSKRPAVPATGNTITYNIDLNPNVMSLDAITTSATSDPTTGVKMPMAVTRLDGEQMPVPSLTNGGLGVSGKVAGVMIFAASGDPGRLNTEEYGKIDENGFSTVRDAPLSTFSADVDRASYSNVRRFIRNGSLPPKDAVRVEELINYFHYDYARPDGQHPVEISAEVAPAPWNRAHQIMRVALQSTPIETAKLPENNLVFLLDVSGSMMPSTRLPLAKQAFRLLVDQLREQDHVAIVVYAGSAGLVLPSTSGANKTAIIEALDRLQAGGSTAGGEGIKLAYDIASKNFVRGGNNRVILATDGDFNVGISNTGDLVRFVEERRGEGIALTALGFGMGNIKDSRLEQLADRGNGNYAYIDDLDEARKVFVHEMGATLVTVAKDVKLQIEFNPATVRAYRLIGYENRMLKAQDFTDDRKDAGEMGAGHSVTALYEIVPVGAPMDVDAGSVPALRYQDSTRTAVPAARRSELANVSVRYKMPTSETSQLVQRAVSVGIGTPSTDMRFAMAVAGYGMLLRESSLRGTMTYEDVLMLGRGALGTDREHYRADFIELVQATRALVAATARRD